MKKLLKIHGNCQKYKFNQSEPWRLGFCAKDEWMPLPLSPVALGCDNYVEEES